MRLLSFYMIFILSIYIFILCIAHDHSSIEYSLFYGCVCALNAYHEIKIGPMKTLPCYVEIDQIKTFLATFWLVKSQTPTQCSGLTNARQIFRGIFDYYPPYIELIQMLRLSRKNPSYESDGDDDLLTIAAWDRSVRYIYYLSLLLLCTRSFCFLLFKLASSASTRASWEPMNIYCSNEFSEPLTLPLWRKTVRFCDHEWDESLTAWSFKFLFVFQFMMVF